MCDFHRLSSPESPFEKDRGRTRTSRRRLTDYAITLPETPPPVVNYGNHTCSEDSNSEHSFASYNSSPCQELLCDLPRQYQSAFPVSSPVGSYGPQASPRNGFYHNSRHQSSPSFHKAYYNQEMVYAADLDLAHSYYAQHTPCPPNRYEYWYKDAAVPHHRAQRPLPPDPRLSPSPAQWDHPHYRAAGLPQQVVNEQLKSWHRRSQFKAPRSRSLDRQGAVRVKHVPAQEASRYQNQKYTEQVSRRNNFTRGLWEYFLIELVAKGKKSFSHFNASVIKWLMICGNILQQKEKIFNCVFEMSFLNLKMMMMIKWFMQQLTKLWRIPVQNRSDGIVRS